MEETPSPEKIPTQEEWNALKAEAERYSTILEEKLSLPHSNSLNHIVRSLLSSLSAIKMVPFDVVLSFNLAGEQYAVALRAIDQSKKYLYLLDTFPKFKEKEESEGPGYFPDLITIETHVKELVSEYETRLYQETAPV